MNRRRHSANETLGSVFIEFQVIGELKANPNHLLLLGNDGRCYDYHVVGRETAPLERDAFWAVHVIDHTSIRMKPDTVLLATWLATATNASCCCSTT